MKKVLTIALCFVLALTCLSLVACGDPNQGTYNFKSVSMTVGGTTTTYNIGDVAPWGDDVLAADTNVLELKANGVMVSSSKVAGNTVPQEGTYTIDGENITMTVGTSTMTGTIKDGIISISSTTQGVTLTYVYEKA